MIVRALIVWFAMVAVAIGNGTFRVAVLNPRLGDGWGHAVSTLLLCLLIVLLSWATIGWIDPASRSRAVAVGLLWLLLTVGFEFGFGHWVVHKPWAELVADYNIFRGRIWILALLATGGAPYFTARLRGLF